MFLKNGLLTLRCIYTVNDLRAIAEKWDNLWLKSAVCLPRSRANLLALWIEHFSDEDNFKAIIVEQSEEIVAALPLIIKPFKKYFQMGKLANHGIVFGGDFLLDPECDIPAVIDTIVAELVKSSFSFICFEDVAYLEDRWLELLKGFKRAGLLLTDISEHYKVGCVSINGDWSSYEKGLSNKHRYNRRRHAKLLANEGEIKLVVLSEFLEDQIETHLLRGFEVEDRSWKGIEGTSVLKTPGAYESYQKEAIFLAKQGQIELVFLELKGKPIAFNYGWHSKGIHYTAKVGYDEEFAKFGPGQQLMMQFIRYLQDLPQSQLLDFCGPLVPWSESWSTETYPVGRIFLSTDSYSSKLFFQLNFKLKPMLLNFFKGKS